MIIKSSWDWFYFKSHRSWLTKRYSLIFRLDIHTYYFIQLHTKSTGNKWKLEGSWRINLWITCKKPDPNRSIFIDFGTSSKVDEKSDFWTSVRKYAWGGTASVSAGSPPHTFSGVSSVKIHQKNAPKNMKNCQFLSNFLYVHAFLSKRKLEVPLVQDFIKNSSRFEQKIS